MNVRNVYIIDMFYLIFESFCSDCCFFSNGYVWCFSSNYCNIVFCCSFYLVDNEIMCKFIVGFMRKVWF